jgi:hypothetical protein
VRWVVHFLDEKLTEFPEQTLIMNFHTIMYNLAADVTAMQATQPFADGVTQPIVDALTEVSTSSEIHYVS